MRPSPRDKPQRLTDALLRKWRLPDPAGEGSKEARGRVLVIAGAVEMPGAAILASTAGLRAGAGKARVAIAEPVALAVATAVPELFVFGIGEGRRRNETLAAVVDSAITADAVLIGSGMRDSKAIKSLLPRLLKIEKLRALVIDATALPIAAKLLQDDDIERGHIVLTPHAAEMATMMQLEADEVSRDPHRVAREAAQRFGATIVLKGAQTVICGATGSAYLNDRGNVGLATAGSGDVLAGFISGLCARGADPLQAAAWAVAVHARAGEVLARRVGPVGYLAREILGEIPALLGGTHFRYLSNHPSV